MALPKLGQVVQEPLPIPEGATFPRTRAECGDGPRPCPWMRCKWHLASDSAIPVREMTETCTLDVSEDGGVAMGDISDILGTTRQNIDIVITRALKKLRGCTCINLTTQWRMKQRGEVVQKCPACIAKEASDEAAERRRTEYAAGLEEFLP